MNQTPKNFIETYIHFLILNQISDDVLGEHSVGLLDFGNLIGDISFIEFIYHQLWDKVDHSEKKVLNEVMKIYNVLKKD
jgi:hypothetical protein